MKRELRWANYTSILRLKDPNLGLVLALQRHGGIELIQVDRKEGCACPGAGGNALTDPVGVTVTLLDDIDKPLATGRIEALEFGVVKQVVRVAGDRQIEDRFTGGRVKDDEPGGLTTPNQKPRWPSQCGD